MMKTKTLFLSFALLLCQLGFAKQIMSSERLIEYSKFESSIIPSQDNSDWLSSHYSGKKKNEKIEKVEPAFWWSWHEEYPFTVDGIWFKYSNI